MKTLSLIAALAALSATQARADKPSTSSAGVLKADVLKNIDGMEKKYLGLAEATPQEKYSFRPSEGVRSAGEVFMHVGGANYFIGGFAGIKPPEGLSRDDEKKITEKAKVIEYVKASFSHLRKGVEAIPEADLTKAIKLFGGDSTVQSALFIIVNHMHEHLGQAIAYARMSGVTPPWSKGD